MRLRAIQVGLGDFGRRWLRIINEHPSWRVAAIVTRNAEVREQCGTECAVPPQRRFATLEEALAGDVDADALIVTTPHFLHEHDVVAGLDRGLHVLVEKPLAGSWDECLRIREAARSASSIVMVGENYRFGDGAREARRIVESGEIGVPEFLSMHYFVGHTFPAGDWRNDYRYPVLTENATHQFDLVRYVTGTDPHSVFCTAFGSSRTPHWAAPNVSAQFTMSGGFHFQFSASWSYSEMTTPWEGAWRLYGSEGALSWQQDRIEVIRGTDTRFVDVPSKPSDHTIGATLEEFTASLEAHRAPATSIDDNMKTIAMVFGAIRSSELGAPVSIDAMLDESPPRG